MIYERYVKRLIDLFLSISGIILLSPIFLIIIICIKNESNGPVFFKQFRVGKRKTEFKIFKFRTMKVNTPKNIPTWLLESPENYITKVGKFLRKTSLDELPQIINIIKGEMSIIGPRPVIRNEEDLYFEREKYGVYNLKPGLTGWAQINGRDTLTFKEKARLDGYYANNISFLFDLKIFILTILRVLKSEGVREGMAVVEKEK